MSYQLKALEQKDQNSSAFIERQQETIDELNNEVNQLKEIINGERIRFGGSVFGRHGTPSTVLFQSRKTLNTHLRSPCKLLLFLVHNGARICDISVDDPDCSMENLVGEVIGNDIILDLKESLNK